MLSDTVYRFQLAVVAHDAHVFYRQFESALRRNGFSNELIWMASSLILINGASNIRATLEFYKTSVLTHNESIWKIHPSMLQRCQM